MKVDEEWRKGTRRLIKFCTFHSGEVRQGQHLNILFGGYFEQNRCHVFGCTGTAVITYELIEVNTDPSTIKVKCRLCTHVSEGKNDSEAYSNHQTHMTLMHKGESLYGSGKKLESDEDRRVCPKCEHLLVQHIWDSYDRKWVCSVCTKECDPYPLVDPDPLQGENTDKVGE